MTCRDCIAQANDFIDDTLGPVERARHAAHIQRCAPCARYHRVLRNGLQLAHDVGEIQPSPGFSVRLESRLLSLDDERSRRERAVLSGATVAIAVAGLIALAAWAPVWQEVLEARASEALLASQRPLAELPPVAFPSWEWWYGGPVSDPAVLVVNRSAAFPGPYSPLVVQPPIVNGANRGTLHHGDSE